MGAVIIKRNPTFKRTVVIPDVEGEVRVEFEFKRMRRTPFVAYLQSQEFKDRSDVDNVMEFVVGWDCVEPFSREAVANLCEDFHAAGRSIINDYVAAQSQVKTGN